jgi:hypothetical protein
VKQKVGEKSCVAYVAAMATGTTPDQFKAFCRTLAIAPKDSPPYEDIHLYAYLLLLGYLVGYRLDTETQLPDVPIPELGFKLEMPIAGTPAYVVARGVAGHGHALYWDGKQLWDPAPGKPDGVHPSRFKIWSWTPIYKVT